VSATIDELTKATNSLKVATELLKKATATEPKNIELHKALRDACIQRFEFCIELSWKTSIKLLGLETKAPNPAIRDMAQNKLIDDTDIWFEFLIARNKTSHTYAEEVAKAVFLEVERLLPELDQLLSRLRKLK
jgi:nucleotidyltransferase substrate binding protein (TIGR01987 family)